MASKEDLIRCPGLGDIKVLLFHLNGNSIIVVSPLSSSFLALL